LEKKEKWYNEIEANICVVIAIAMLAILTQQIFSRYIFHSTNAWADELTRYMLVWFAYMAASIAVFKNVHIKIDLVLAIWPRAMRPYLKLFSNVIFFIYCIAVVYFSANQTYDLYASGGISLGMGIPLWTVHLIIPLGHLFMAIRLIQLEIRLIKNPELLQDSVETEDEVVEKAIRESKEVGI